jgi:eukaryotic-like serine/threonine-protein kinase
MNAEKLKQIEEIYHAALKFPPDERDSFFKDACGADDDLRREIESLFSFENTFDSFIDTPPEVLATQIIFEKENSAVIGSQINQYKIQKLLGKGGMGAVYLARDARLERQAALKILPPYFVNEPNRLARFVREAKAASALNHPNIITIYEIGETKNTHFIAAEYIEGETLHAHLKNQAPSLKTVIEIAVQVASALDAAHRAGIVHRDIKPENVMIRPDGLVKVLDFGIAKLSSDFGLGIWDGGLNSEESENPPSQISNPQSTSSGMIIGTANYMSPEQTRGNTVDARSDIFNFGIVLYEMLAGNRAFAGESAIDTIGAIQHKEPVPLNQLAPEVPPEIERIVSKTLRKDRAERYQTAKDLLIDLQAVKQDLEFAAKLEHSVPPDAHAEYRLRQTAPADAAQTGGGDFQTTSSAEYIAQKINRHKFGAIAALILSVLAAAAFFYLARAPVLNDKDTVLIANFENRTDEPVFTGTLKLGLAVQLRQSPFLKIFPEAEVRETLRLMKLGADERLTPEIAREICQRQGIKAFITGSIAPLGNHYVITLEAVNTQTGEPIISEQNEAESKEQVLNILGKTATHLREKLGESLASIEKFDAPIARATTSSLDALKAYSMGMELSAKGGNQDEAIVSLFHLAIKLDPNFALVYRDLARHQFNSGKQTEAVASSAKAFELRERTSENEKLSIEVLYYEFAARDLEKAAETAELWKRTFPRFWQPFHSLSDIYFGLGQNEKAVENGLEAVRLNPNFSSAYANPAGALVLLNRFAEAKELYRRAMSQNLDHLGYHLYLFWIGYFEQDAAAMRQQIDWMRNNNYKHFALEYESQLALLEGRWKQSLELSRRARAESEKYGDRNLVASLFAWDAHTGALYGDCPTAKQSAAQVFALSENNNLLADAALALALCGEDRQALRIADELAARFPKDTVLRALRLPTVRAAVELRRGRPDQALELLESTKSYQGHYLNFAPFVRGLVLLRKEKPAEAATVFQNIHENPGGFGWTPLVPLAHLWEARALALTGDTARSRQAYEQLFALWKDADADMPILIEAQKEHRRLK